MHIAIEEIEHRIILRLSGRLDAQSAPILERKINQLIDEGHFYLLLDFNHIDYLSSAGMRILLSSTKKVKPKKGAFVLFGIAEDVGEIIQMAGFDKILHIYSTEKEALQQLIK